MAHHPKVAATDHDVLDVIRHRWFIDNKPHPELRTSI